MEEKYSVDSFGEARMMVSRKGCKKYITAFGTIKAIEKKVILFQDNDDFMFLVDKKDFHFEKHEKNHDLIKAK